MKIHLLSLGCHKNLVDSEIMLALLNENGFELTNNLNSADTLIINTCGFIKDAKTESIEKILTAIEYKKSGKIKYLIVTGCLTQRYFKELLKEMPQVDAFIGTSDLKKIVNVCKNITNKKNYVKKIANFTHEKNLKRKLLTPKHLAYIKISEGCNKRCSFCIIPQLKGRYKSRRISDIINEATQLVSGGVKEINIIAQDTTEYGVDLYKQRKLPQLLKKLCKIENLKWIRLFYTYPKNFNDELIEVIKTQNKICKYIDIPLQHISNEILKNMNRFDTKEEIILKLKKIREEISDVTIRTTLIVGFPGETEKQFNELKEFVKKEKFDYLGVFEYSKEEETKAYQMKNHLSEKIKQKRKIELLNIQEKIATSYIGNICDVIIDKKSDDNSYEGRTSFQAFDIDGIVFLNGTNLKIGDFVKVKLIDKIGYDYIGEIV